MFEPHGRRAVRVLGAGLAAVALAIAACNSNNPTTPVVPTPTQVPPNPSQTLVITSTGVHPSLVYMDADQPIRIVNSDTQAHRMHLDFSDQPGCSAFDSAGEIPPGETRVTGVITNDAAGCDVHDHMHHGDRRFSAQIVVGDSSR